MEHKYEQKLQDIKDIIKKKPKLYHDPRSSKKCQVTVKASPKGKVKVFTEEEIFLYKLKRFKRPQFNF